MTSKAKAAIDTNEIEVLADRSYFSGPEIKRCEELGATSGSSCHTRIDIQTVLKTKINVDFRPYTILGACSPKLAHEALQLEDKVGTMLPCNVVVKQKTSGEIEVAAINPVASMQAIENPELKKAAEAVRDKLSRVIDLLRSS